MKITFGELKPLLQAQRIFVGGQKLVCAHAFYRDDLPIEIPENLTTEAYTTYWGRCGERLASLGAFSYTRTLLPALIKVGRYTSIADRLQVLGDRHPLEWASASPVFYAHHSGVMATLAADSGRPNQTDNHRQRCLDWPERHSGAGHYYWRWRSCRRQRAGGQRCRALRHCRR
jgi:hypothetical protein